MKSLKRSFRSELITLLLIVVSSVPVDVLAQIEGNPENWCRSGFFPKESKEYKLARVTGNQAERAYFFSDDREDCPGGNNCKRKAYLIPGDVLIISRSLGKYSCGWFQPAKGSETVGWIENARIEYIKANANPVENDWLGEWRHYDNSIVISKGKAGVLNVTGEATWSFGDNIHSGELDHSAKPSNNQLKLGEDETDEYACKVTMFWLGKYLIVSDNMYCGGANVSFSGVYQRKSGK